MLARAAAVGAQLRGHIERRLSGKVGGIGLRRKAERAMAGGAGDGLGAAGGAVGLRERGRGRPQEDGRGGESGQAAR